MTPMNSNLRPTGERSGMRGSRWQTVLAVLAACGLTLGVLFLSLSMAVTSYHATLDTARQNARFVSSLLAGQVGMILLDTEGDLESIGRLLTLLPDRHVQDHRDQLHEMLTDIRRKRPYVRRLLVTDPQGRPTDWTSQKEPPDTGALDYIQAHLAGSPEVFVGTPRQQSRHARDWGFGISVGLRGKDGRLTRIMAAEISLDLLLETFLGQDIPPGVGFMVTDLAGRIYIYEPGQAQFVGRSIPVLKSYVEEEGQGGTYVGRSPVEDEELASGSTLVNRYPLVAYAGYPLDQVLAPWKRHALVYGGASLVLLLVVSALSVLLVRGQMRLNRQGRQLALAAATDLLTGALNRRAFMESANREFARMCRYGGELSCVVIDLDHFKAVNDTHGHAAGDLALTAAARLIASRLRQTDLFCRHGGEEFALLLPGTSPAQAVLLAEALRRELAELSLEVDGKRFGITASFGVAGNLPDDSSVDTGLNRADKALYRAKAEGRNRVCEAPVRRDQAETNTHVF